MEKYGFDGLSNLAVTIKESNEIPFENINVSVLETKYNDLYERKISQIISVLRSRVTDVSFEDGSFNDAIISLSRFVSLMGDAIEKYQEEIQFDTDLSDSIEVTFKGHGVTRFNLMFTEIGSSEEAFLFYMRNGRPTQINGSLPIMVDLLKKILG